jgi:hypothetical protein
MPFDASLLIPVVGSIFGLICLVAAQRQMRHYRLLQDLPTSKTTGVFIGLVELKGTAEAEQPLVSYLAGERCVYYSWNIAERWSRTVTETYRDSDGKTKTRTRHESGWTTVANGGGSIPFYLRDDCGVIRVLPEHAKIHAKQVFSESCHPSDELYYSKGPSEGISDSDHVRQFNEDAIPLHAQLYVVGQSRERDDVVAPEIAHDDHVPMFLISTKEEESVVGGHRWSLIGLLLLGLVLCGGAFFVFSRVLNSAVVGGWIVAAAVYLMAAAIAWTWTAFNSLVGLRQRVRQGWATIEVLLKRRHDLIPPLVEIVSVMSEYEQTAQTAIVELRNQLTATPPGVAGPDYQGVSRQLVAVAETYPQITAQESFLRLQKELSNTESRIALARGYYNEIVSYWNTRVSRIPDNVIAWLAGMHPEQLLQTRGFERENVEVVLVNGAGSNR